MSEPSDQDPQVFTGRYQLRRHLARGGMAEVYVAHDLMLDRRVALKVLFPELSTDPSFVERFRREAQAAANLSHPNIVSIYDWGEEDGTYFIVMEYVEGRTLGQIIRGEGPLLPDRAADVAADVAAALDYAHRSGVVHRDVKPGNVLVANNGQVKVTDFGIARALNSDQDLTQTGSVMGTATYFSPEQAQGERVDARSDIYSLGVVLYEMVVGRPPFQGDNAMAIAYKHVREEPVPPRRANPDVSQAFEAVILQAMAKNPNDRYVTAEELRQDLLRFRAGRAVLASPTVEAPAYGDATRAAPVVDDATRAVDHTQVATSTMTAERRGPGGGPPPPKRGVGPFVVLLLVMLAVLGGLLFLFGRETGLISDDKPDRVTMPFVIGKTEDEARRQLEDMDLEVATETEVNSEQEPGRVFAQSPDANSPVDKGAEVVIRVSAEPEKVRVPTLVGKDIDAARDLLEAAGLNAKIENRTDRDVEEDEVISQNPAPDTELAKGSDVTLVVSAGKAQKTVPDVADKTEAEAANELGQAGFKVKSANETSDTIAKGRVIRTDPAAGDQAPEGATITLVVSSGPDLPTVPNVIGMSPGEAEAAIKAAGFTYAEGATVPSNAGDDGKVVAQSPSGGTQAEKGSRITVRVGKFTLAATTTTSTTSTTEP